MFYHSCKSLLSIAVFILLFSGCQQQLASDDSSVANESVAAERIELFVERVQRPWKIFVSDHKRTRALTRKSASLPTSDVTLSYMDKLLRQDALKLSWNDDWRAELAIKQNEPIDLRAYLSASVLSFDINVLELAKGGVAFKLNCGHECERKVPFTEQATELAGKGWKNIRIDMSCFVQEGDDFSEVVTPFIMETGGTGEVAVANIQLLKVAQGNTRCPDYKTVAITPEKLNEYWARDWWEPRHQEKLERIKQGNIDLLMIGDSITEGWAKEGKDVWEKYYAGRNAVNLGYGGDRTENVLWRLQHGEVDGINPKVAVLMIGTNNTGHRLERPKYTALGIKAIVDELRVRLPQTHILLLAVFPREQSPEAHMRKINDEINNIIASYADNEQVYFLNINHHFLDANGILSRAVMPDLLHLNESSYRIWAGAMEPVLSHLLEK